MTKVGPQVDQWFAHLNTFHKLVRYQQKLLQLRALVYGGLIVSLSSLVFVLYMAPRSGFIITFPLLLIPLLALAAPVISLVLRSVEKKRNDLARTFFMAGFRVDETGRLITNAAHPEVIAQPSSLFSRPGLAA